MQFSPCYYFEMYIEEFQNFNIVLYLALCDTSENLIQVEIKRRLNSGNGCYHSVQNNLSSRLLY
jgi:hypothetical protein